MKNIVNSIILFILVTTVYIHNIHIFFKDLICIKIDF
jgi:hypothetical protein